MTPDYLLTLASYLWPDADDAESRRRLRFEAVRELRSRFPGCVTDAVSRRTLRHMGDLRAVPAVREVLPEPGTVYSMAGPNTGCPARLVNAAHYPVEAVCGGPESACRCGGMIRSEHLYDGWTHTGRMPGAS